MNEPSTENHPPMQRPRIRNNPVILRECIALLRKKSAFLYLLAFLSSISLVFILILPHLLNTYSLYQYSNVRSRKIIVLLEVFQGILILILTPLFSSTSVNTEYERKTWDLLISTPINVPSILLGKYFSSILYVLLLISSLIPVYSLTMTLGGVSPQEILFIFCIMLELAVTTGAIGLYCSIRWKRTVQSVSFTYLFMSLLYFVPPALIMMNFSPNNQPLGPFIFSSPLMIWLRYIASVNLYGCSTQTALAIHGVFAAGILIALWRLCIRAFNAPPNNMKRPIDWRRPFLLFSTSAPNWTPFSFRDSKRRDSSIYKKELDGMLAKSEGRFLNTLIAIAMGSAFVLFLSISSVEKERITHGIASCLFTATLLIPCLVLPYGANCLRSEFDRDTWTLLVATVLTPVKIVQEKMRAGFMLFLYRFTAFLLPPFLCLSLVSFFYGCGFIHPSSKVALWTQIAGGAESIFQFQFVWLFLFLPLFYIAAQFYLMQGMFLSTFSQKTSSAYAAAFLVAVLLLLLPSGVLLFLKESGTVNAAFLYNFLHPIAAILSPFHLLVFLSSYKNSFEPKFIFNTISTTHREWMIAIQIVWLAALTQFLKIRTVHRMKKLMNLR